MFKRGGMEEQKQVGKIFFFFEFGKIKLPAKKKKKNP